VSDQNIKGTFKDGSFNLNFTQTLPALELAFLKSGTEWRGVVVEEVPFGLTIKKQDDARFEGVINWPTRNTKTKVIGKIEKEALTFSEYDYLEGSGVNIPMKYSGKIDNNKLVGNFEHDGEILGEFNMQMP